MEDQPHDLDEAMVVDGASPLTRFLRLALPLARPALAAVAIFTFIGSWEEFVLALTLNNSPEHLDAPGRHRAVPGPAPDELEPRLRRLDDRARSP